MGEGGGSHAGQGGSGQVHGDHGLGVLCARHASWLRQCMRNEGDQSAHELRCSQRVGGSVCCCLGICVVVVEGQSVQRLKGWSRRGNGRMWIARA